MDTTSISELPNVTSNNNIIMTQMEKEPQLSQTQPGMQTYQPIPLEPQVQTQMPDSVPTQMQQTENAANIKPEMLLLK